MKTGSNVMTPIGQGVVQGMFEVRQAGETVERCVLVRVEVTEAVRPHLRSPHCMTPSATSSALFTFAMNSLK